MRPLIEEGYLYIAQPPLFRAKRGQSEVYLKDQRALDGYLIDAGLKEAVLTLADGTQIGGEELRELTNKATHASRLIEQVGRHLGNKEVVEQAAIAGMLSAGTLDSAEAAEYLAKRLEGQANDMEKGWTGNVEGEGALANLVVQRRLRGITERYVIDRRLLGHAETSQLDEMAANLQQIYGKPATLRLGQTATTLNGPSALSQAIFQTGRKGAQISRYKGLGEMNPEQLWETTLDPDQRVFLQVSIEQEEEADNAFSTLMGEAVEERRNFIQENALSVANLDV